MRTIVAMLLVAMPAIAQTRTTATLPDGTRIVVDSQSQLLPKAVAPKAQPRQLARVREVVVLEYIEVRQAPVEVLFVVPAKAPVSEYRTGLLGLRRNVVHADGSVTQYGPLGRRKR